jgi:hypothetical protein
MEGSRFIDRNRDLEKWGFKGVITTFNSKKFYSPRPKHLLALLAL